VALNPNARIERWVGATYSAASSTSTNSPPRPEDRISAPTREEVALDELRNPVVSWQEAHE
jgi:hypothetical protein